VIGQGKKLIQAFLKGDRAQDAHSRAKKSASSATPRHALKVEPTKQLLGSVTPEAVAYPETPTRGGKEWQGKQQLPEDNVASSTAKEEKKGCGKGDSSDRCQCTRMKQRYTPAYFVACCTYCGLAQVWCGTWCFLGLCG
jgi:hypothetical protein